MLPVLLEGSLLYLFGTIGVFTWAFFASMFLVTGILIERRKREVNR